MIYTVTYLSATGGELSTFVEADTVSYDPHWVSFKRAHSPQIQEHSSQCDTCGRNNVFTRPSRAVGTDVVAIYPAPRIRRVEESRNVE